VTAQALIFILFFYYKDRVAYLWYNLIGCVACVLFSLVLQLLLGRKAEKPHAA
jgi:hypothetical protein